MNQLYSFNIGEPVEGVPSGLQKGSALSTLAKLFVTDVGADAVEAGSTQTIIVATAHGLKRGDQVTMTSGATAGEEVYVSKVINANSFEIKPSLSAVPAAADTFDVARFLAPRVDNSGALILSTGVTGQDILATEYHDVTANNINDNAAAFVAVGSGAAIGAIISKIHVTTTVGEPLDFRIGANAGAAAANPRKFIVNRGEGPLVIECQFTATDLLWVRSLTVVDATAGEIVINFIG